MHRSIRQSIRISTAMVVICYAIFVAPALRAQIKTNFNADVNQPLEGVLEPWKSSNVSCAESGLLDTVFVKPGDHVTAGDKLAQLDLNLSEVQLAIAQAQAESKGRMEQVEAEAELAEKKVRAIQQAREKKHSTQSELDRALAESKIVQGRLQSERDESKILKLQAERMKTLMDQRRVISPIDGIVQKVFKSSGEFVSPNAPEVVRVVDVSKLRATFYLELNEVALLQVGSKIQVALSGGERKPALVEHIAPFPDGGSGMIEVQVLVENPESKLVGSRCSLLLERSTELISGR
jgi:RND family efflux transporter MFP subunit